MSNNNLDRLAELRWPGDFIDKVICGDCLEVMKLIPDKSIDLILADPPYGIGFNYNENFTDYNEPKKYGHWLKKVIKQTSRILKDQKWAFFWQAMPYCNEWHKWFPAGYRIFAGIKNFAQYRPIHIQYSWDPIIFWNMTKSEIKGQAGLRDYHIGNTARWVAEPSMGHPCPRPLDTVKFIISMCSNIDDVVLDPFLGSGTTAVACKELGRHLIGIEINPEYCKIAERRLAQTAYQPELAL